MLKGRGTRGSEGFAAEQQHLLCKIPQNNQTISTLSTKRVENVSKSGSEAFAIWTNAQSAPPVVNPLI